MARPRNDGGPDVSPALHKRVVQLSELLWQGNRSLMERMLGVDQPTISRVLLGKQKTSAKLLEKLATYPGVNVAWLLLGQGEPLAEGGQRPGVGRFRPLVEELLPGPLGEHEERLTGVSYPIAAAYDSPSSYWYRVPEDSPVTKKGAGRVLAHDLMLMETDARWTRKADAVFGKFCGFRIKKGKRDRVVLGRVAGSRTTIARTMSSMRWTRLTNSRRPG